MYNRSHTLRKATSRVRQMPLELSELSLLLLFPPAMRTGTKPMKREENALFVCNAAATFCNLWQGHHAGISCVAPAVCSAMHTCALGRARVLHASPRWSSQNFTRVPAGTQLLILPPCAVCVPPLVS